MSLHTLAHQLQSAGRGEDKVLVHMTPGEVKGLQALAMSQGGSLSINPQTGLPEAGILSSLLPMVAGFFLGPAGLGLTAMQSAVAVGALGTAATGSLGKGFMMGLGAYGGAGLGAGLTSAGGSTLSNVPGEFGVNAGTGTGADYAKWMASDAGQAAAAQTGTTTAQTVASNVAPGTGGFEALKPQGIFSNPNVSAYGAAPTVTPPVTTTPMQNASDVFREGLASPSEFVRPTPGASLQDKIMTGGAEKTGTFTAPEAKPLTYDQATPTWDASKPATAPSNWDKAKAGFDKATGSWEGAKEVWNATPTGTGYGLAATGMSVLQAQQEEAAAEAKAKADAMAAARRGYYRPYDFSTEQDPRAYANTSTAESRYFVEPRFIAQPIEKIAKEGGIMSLAVGGPVEQMAAQNSVGNNTMYPQSQLQTSMYSNPMVQRPMPTNVIQSGIDAPVGMYTGEQRFADGGSTSYKYDPTTMKYTGTTTPAAPASNSGGKYTTDQFRMAGINPDLAASFNNTQVKGLMAPAFVTYVQNKLGSAQQPATTIETLGGTMTPYMPPSGLAAVPQQIIPNIPMQPQQNIDRQLGLEAFYPMMEKQLALKGSNLQARGYADGGIARFGGGGAAQLANPEAEARHKYAAEHAPGIIKYVTDDEWNAYKKLNDLSFKSAASAAPTYKYNPATMQYTDNAGKVTGGLQPQFIPMEVIQPEQQIGMTGYQGYAGGGVSAKKPEANNTWGGPGHSIFNPATHERNNAPSGPAQTLIARLPQYQDNARGQQAASQLDVTTLPTYVFNPQTQQFIDQAGNVTGGLGGYQGYAEGGTANGGYSLGSYSDGGRLLRGPGDGVSDSIPASIGDRQPARLADGEFVVPARIVSEIGNGSTEAGARKLYAMMDRVQKARKKTVGKNKVAVNTRADKLLPA